MQIRKIIPVIILGVLVPVSLLLAQDITVSSTVLINLSSFGRTLEILNTSDALNTIEVNDGGSILTLELAAGSGSVTINSPDGLNLGGFNNTARIGLSYCNSSGSQLVIPALASGTRTVLIGPDNTLCYSASGGSSGGSSSSGGASSVSPPAVTPPAVTPPAVVQEPVKETEKAKDEDKEGGKIEEEIEFIDIAKLSPDIQKIIVDLATLMVGKNTYKIPKNKKFFPNKATDGEFALQTILAVSGIGCGSDCKKQAVSNKIVNSKFKLNTKVSRILYYGMLLKAMGVPLDKASVKDLKTVCKDAGKATTQMARVFITARRVGIASVYKGEKCGLNSAFPRSQATQFAVRALNIK